MARDPEKTQRTAASIRRATTGFQRRLRSEGGPGRLAPAKLSVLGNLRRAHDARTPGELAAADGVKPQSLTRVLAELEQEALVTRTQDPEDARQSRIALTEAGSSALEGDVRGRDVWLARSMMRELSPTEREVLRLAAGLMERLTDLDRPLASDRASEPAVHAPSLAGRAAPVLPTHDSGKTAAFFTRIGFVRGRGSDDEYLMLQRDGIDLHFSLTSDVDPFRTAGVAYLWVPDADAFRGEILDAEVPAVDTIDGLGAGDPTALAARWDRERDLSRVGAIEEKPWRVREFALFDPTGNLLRVGHPIGLNRAREARRENA